MRELTYSIVAVNVRRGLGGVAVASGSVAVGSRVPWCVHGVACVATQAFTNPALGPRVINAVASGLGAEEALKAALSTDARPERRQVGVATFSGDVACYTGSEAPESRGCVKGVVGGDTHYVVVGNLLRSAEVVKAAALGFARALRGGSDLIEALLAGLEAAADAGGDARGERSAALIVVGETEWGREYDRVVDARVDLSTHPLRELREVIELLRPKPGGQA